MHCGTWVWLAAIALTYHFSMITYLRRLYLRERKVKEVMGVLGGSEHQLGKWGTREVQLQQLTRRPGLFSDQTKRCDYKRHGDSGGARGASDEEKMKTVVSAALLGKRADELRRKESKQEIVKGLQHKAEELREEVRLLELVIEGFRVWECAIEDVPVAEV